MNRTTRHYFTLCVLLLIVQLPACTTLKQQAQNFIAPSTPMSFSEARTFERRHLNLAQKLIEKNEWNKAQDVYDEALKRRPQSKVLRVGLKKMYQKNREYTEKLTRELTISRGLWLDKNHYLYESLAKAEIKGKKAQYKNRAIKNEIKLISKQLAHYGNYVATDNQTNNVEYLLNLSEQLKQIKPNQHTPIEKNNRKTVKLIKNTKKDPQKIKLEKLLASHKKAYKNKKLQLAHQLIKQASELRPNDKKIKAEKTRLAEEIEIKIKQHLSNGLQFYSDGNYESALGSWQETLNLDTNNQEALDNIERTNKILVNLSRIKEKQDQPSE